MSCYAGGPLRENDSDGEIQGVVIACTSVRLIAVNDRGGEDGS